MIKHLMLVNFQVLVWASAMLNSLLKHLLIFGFLKITFFYSVSSATSQIPMCRGYGVLNPGLSCNLCIESQTLLLLYSARSHPHSVRSHPFIHSARPHPCTGQIASTLGQISSTARLYRTLDQISSTTRLYLIHAHMARSHPHSARSHPQLGYILSIHSRLDRIPTRLDLIHSSSTFSWIFLCVNCDRFTMWNAVFLDPFQKIGLRPPPQGCTMQACLKCTY